MHEMDATINQIMVKARMGEVYNSSMRHAVEIKCGEWEEVVQGIVWELVLSW